MSDGRAATRFGLVTHYAPGGGKTHAYRLSLGTNDPHKTLCGRQRTAGTSRGHAWHDDGEIVGRVRAGDIACEECRRIFLAEI
ncbi:MAG: hypothetical protein FJ033_12750 [Chloroflexi bacterium]|nr:hypothetical protein [Chloroflexota bacterium]